MQLLRKKKEMKGTSIGKLEEELNRLFELNQKKFKRTIEVHRFVSSN